jgi:hypothetical protein
MFETVAVNNPWAVLNVFYKATGSFVRNSFKL